MTSVCDWNTPGHDPYTGTTAGALSHYDMPDTTRRRLADRIDHNDFDTVVSVTREGVTGYAGMRNMHFGKDRMCHKIDTSKWSKDAVQLGFVFIENGHHIVKWFICHNLTELVPLPPAPTGLHIIGEAEVPELPLSYPQLSLPLMAVAVEDGPMPIPVTFGGAVVFIPSPGPFDVVPRFIPNTVSPVPHPAPVFPVEPPVSPIPEPATWAMLGAGVLALIVRARMR